MELNENIRCDECQAFTSNATVICPNCKNTDSSVDRLQQIMNAQAQLRFTILAKYGSRYPKTDEGHVAYMADCIIAEAQEMKNETNWKAWKTPKDVDFNKLRAESIDIFTFVVNVFGILGMSAEDVLKEYMAKNKVNLERQQNGY